MKVVPAEAAFERLIAVPATQKIKRSADALTLQLLPNPDIVGRERVIAGTDCGFAQGPFYRRVHPSIMWAKFEALSEGARLATKELWGK